MKLSNQSTDEINWLDAVIYPAFLQHIDTRLMKRNKALWALQLHHAAYLGAVVAVIAFVLSSLIPINQPVAFYTLSIATRWLIFALQAVALFVWLWRLARWNRENRYLLIESDRDKSVWRQVGGYWLGAMLIMLALPLMMGNFRLQNHLRADRNQLATNMLLIRIVEDREARGHSAQPVHRSRFLRLELESDVLEKLPVYFGWVDYWVNDVDAVAARTFIAENVTQSDIDQLLDAYERGEDPLLEEVLQFEGRQSSELGEQFLLVSDMTFYQFRYGFDDTQPNIRNALIVSAALAMHIAVLGLIMRWGDARQLRATFIAIVTTVTVIVAGFAFGAVVPYYSMLGRYFNGYAVCVMVVAAAVWMLAAGNKPTGLGRMRATAATVLPVFVVVIPFVLICWSHFNNFIQFPWPFVHDQQAYSLRSWRWFGLQDWWVQLVSQFYHLPLIPLLYIPLLPLLKRRLTQAEQAQLDASVLAG